MYKVLIVDDEQINHTVLNTYFKKQPQFIVTNVNSGKEAIDLIERGETYDLIIMDAMMPEIDGFETSKKIREIEKDFIPILMLTALSDKNSRSKAVEAKINQFITKPIDFFEFELAIKNMIQLKSLFSKLNIYKEIYLGLLNNITDIIVLTSEEGKVIFTNDNGNRFITKYNLNRENFLESVKEQFNCKKFDEIEAIKQLKKGSISATSINYSDNYYQVVIASLPLIENNEEKKTIVFIFKDITEYLNKTRLLETSLEKRKKDLQRASFIQKNLIIEKIEPTKKYIVKSFYIPSSSIGGDYHTIMNYEDYIGGIIADVSGHGIEAALYGTILLMSVEQNKKILFKDTGEFLRKVDETICSFNLDYNFITAFAFRLDKRKNIFYYSNAGHNAPFYKKDSQNEKTALPIEKGGPPLGVGFKFEFQEEKIDFEKENFKIIIYTDGLVEDFLNESKVASDKKINRILYSDNWLKEMEKIKNEFLNLEEHPDVDDTTIIIIERKNPIKLQATLKKTNEIDIVWKKIEMILERFNYNDKEIRNFFTIFQELVSNAIKYGKEARIDVKFNTAWSIIRVKDIGEGFDIEEYFKKEIDKKYENFIEEKYSEYPKKDSLGFGLYLAKKKSYKFLYNKRGNIIISIIKKQDTQTEYISKYEVEEV